MPLGPAGSSSSVELYWEDAIIHEYRYEYRHVEEVVTEGESTFYDLCVARTELAQLREERDHLVADIDELREVRDRALAGISELRAQRGYLRNAQRVTQAGPMVLPVRIDEAAESETVANRNPEQPIFASGSATLRQGLRDSNEGRVRNDIHRHLVGDSASYEGVLNYDELQSPRMFEYRIEEARSTQSDDHEAVRAMVAAELFAELQRQVQTLQRQQTEDDAPYTIPESEHALGGGEAQPFPTRQQLPHAHPPPPHLDRPPVATFPVRDAMQPRSQYDRRGAVSGVVRLNRGHADQTGGSADEVHLHERRTEDLLSLTLGLTREQRHDIWEILSSGNFGLTSEERHNLWECMANESLPHRLPVTPPPSGSHARTQRWDQLDGTDAQPRVQRYTRDEAELIRHQAGRGTADLGRPDGPEAGTGLPMLWTDPLVDQWREMKHRTYNVLRTVKYLLKFPDTPH